MCDEYQIDCEVHGHQALDKLELVHEAENYCYAQGRPYGRCCIELGNAGHTSESYRCLIRQMIPVLVMSGWKMPRVDIDLANMKSRWYLSRNQGDIGYIEGKHGI